MHPTLQKILENEVKRQQETLDLIPSENFSSKAVRDAVGSVFMHKYSEGYPGARYYEGNEFIDQIESLCIEMVLKVFKAPSGWSANVQPYSGSIANLAVYNALLNPGDKILSMYLPDGGHLSHGWSYTKAADRSEEVNKELQSSMVYRGGLEKVNIVSKFFNVVQYKTDPETQLFDYDFIKKLAIEEKPKLIITGGTAYPRNINYKRMREIADKVGAIYLADVAHEAGLIAGGAIESPVGIADIVTFTTHKVMRGPKGAVILCKEEFIDKINKSIMPGMQGGPHNGTIAGILQSMFEADSDEFKLYAKNVILNAQALAEGLVSRGFKLVSGGTDKHLVLIDLRDKGLSGRYLSSALAAANIITNKNTIPYDTGSPVNPSGLRIGSPTLTTRGMGLSEMNMIVDWIDAISRISLEINNVAENFEQFKTLIQENSEIVKIKSEVVELAQRFPLAV